MFEDDLQSVMSEFYQRSIKNMPKGKKQREEVTTEIIELKGEEARRFLAQGPGRYITRDSNSNAEPVQ